MSMKIVCVGGLSFGLNFTVMCYGFGVNEWLFRFGVCNVFTGDERTALYTDLLVYI